MVVFVFIFIGIGGLGYVLLQKYTNSSGGSGSSSYNERGLASRAGDFGL